MTTTKLPLNEDHPLVQMFLGIDQDVASFWLAHERLPDVVDDYEAGELTQEAFDARAQTWTTRLKDHLAQYRAADQFSVLARDEDFIRGLLHDYRAGHIDPQTFRAEVKAWKQRAARELAPMEITSFFNGAGAYRAFLSQRLHPTPGTDPMQPQPTRGGNRSPSR